jgi:hypothetical protein
LGSFHEEWAHGQTLVQSFLNQYFKKMAKSRLQILGFKSWWADHLSSILQLGF